MIRDQLNYAAFSTSLTDMIQTIGATGWLEFNAPPDLRSILADRGQTGTARINFATDAR